MNKVRIKSPSNYRKIFTFAHRPAQTDVDNSFAILLEVGRRPRDEITDDPRPLISLPYFDLTWVQPCKFYLAIIGKHSLYWRTPCHIRLQVNPLRVNS